jgi:hypothetical protein
MTRRRARNLTGGLLDCPPNVDPASWTATSLLDKMKPAPLPPACQCRPNNGATDLGGCQPGLRWIDHDTLGAVCRLCQRALLQGRHRRREQVHFLGLAQLGPSNLDLEDLYSWGVMVGERPAPPEPDPALAGMAWPTARAGAPQGVPTAEAIAAAAAALEQAEGQQAWLEGMG